MIKPTIGRVVWVKRVKEETESHQENFLKEQYEPGLICHVFDDRTVNVAGFTAVGETFRLCPVELLQDDDAIPPGRSYACWMPYQIQSAKAAEPPAKTDSEAQSPPVLTDPIDHHGV